MEGNPPLFRKFQPMTLAIDEDGSEVLSRRKKGIAHMFSRRRVDGEKLQGSEPLHDLAERPGAGLPQDILLGVHEKGERHFRGVHENGGAPGGRSGFFKILREEKILFFWRYLPGSGSGENGGGSPCLLPLHSDFDPRREATDRSGELSVEWIVIQVNCDSSEL